MNTEYLFKEDKDLSKALNEFKQQNPNIDSGDIQTFIIGWQAAVKNLIIPIVSNQRELLIAYEVKKHPFLADKYKLEYATKLVDKYLESN